MTEFNKNTGRNVLVKLYVGGAKLGKSFVLITKFDWKPEFYEGVDEYLGADGADPWQQFKGCSGSFSMEEADAGDVQTVMLAITTASQAGVKLAISIVEEVNNNSGTLTRTKFGKITMKPSVSSPGLGSKRVNDWTWTGKTIAAA